MAARTPAAGGALGAILVAVRSDERLGQCVRTCGGGELFVDRMRTPVDVALHYSREQVGLGTEVIEDATFGRPARAATASIEMLPGPRSAAMCAGRLENALRARRIAPLPSVSSPPQH